MFLVKQLLLLAQIVGALVEQAGKLALTSRAFYNGKQQLPEDLPNHLCQRETISLEASFFI